jgi:hypothetical protein
MELICKPEVIKVLLPALFETLQGQSRIASNSCWTVSSLVNAAFSISLDQEDDASGDPDTFILSQEYKQIIDELIKTSER